MNIKLPLVLVMSLLVVGGIISACGSSSPAIQEQFESNGDESTLQPSV